MEARPPYLPFPGSARASALPVTATAEKSETFLQSTALLRGRASVAIQHNGTVYRLQATKLGKLILTK